MSLVEPTLLSLARAAAVAGAALAVLLAAGPGIATLPAAVRRLFFWCAVAALLVPGFLTGFALFQNTPGAHAGLERELRYVALVWMRYAALAVLVVWLSPPRLSGESMHCLRLIDEAPWHRRVRWELRAWGRGLWLGAGLVFLLAFQEFEISTTWNLRAWTVALFDAQVGGLAFVETLRLALLPLAIQVGISAALLLGARTEKHRAPETETISRRSMIGLYVLLISAALGALAPAAPLVHGLLALFKADAPSPLTSLREIGSGALLAACATTAAWLLAGWISRSPASASVRLRERCDGGTVNRVLTNAARGRSVLAVPGLLGSLPCGLLILTLIQVPPLHLLRDTAIPAIAALTLALLPFALLLKAGMDLTCDPAAAHIARESGARRPQWLISGWPRLCAALLLFCFAYGDFTINAMLAPPAFTSPGARLLNLLHYGRSEALVAMFALAFVLPFGAALLTALAARFYPRRRVR